MASDEELSCGRLAMAVRSEGSRYHLVSASDFGVEKGRSMVAIDNCVWCQLSVDVNKGTRALHEHVTGYMSHVSPSTAGGILLRSLVVP